MRRSCGKVDSYGEACEGYMVSREEVAAAQAVYRLHGQNAAVETWCEIMVAVSGAISWTFTQLEIVGGCGRWDAS